MGMWSKSGGNRRMGVQISGEQGNEEVGGTSGNGGMGEWVSVHFGLDKHVAEELYIMDWGTCIWKFAFKKMPVDCFKRIVAYINTVK